MLKNQPLEDIIHTEALTLNVLQLSKNTTAALKLYQKETIKA